MIGFRQDKKGKSRRALLRIMTLVAIASCLFTVPAVASRHYSEKQLDALAARVGKVFWVTSVEGRLPSFLAAPAEGAQSFRAKENESFEIVELVGRQVKNPYYKVKFQSGREGYVRPEAFMEELNATILTVDPLADEKKRAAEAEAEEKKREQWIEKQPWSQEVKEAARRRQAVIGMTSSEVKKVLGPPLRVDAIKRPQIRNEEHWVYSDGSVLVFHHGILSRIESKPSKE
ncbi:MAG TPA: hypothetical protein VNO43_18275 [Candidatus Eisenbacteria bacterium]|nr:hypothetical protein [Candidatus Eisenbacteria bacterium]